MYRTTYSVAICCASAALPPLPQKYNVPPLRTVSRTIERALSSEGPSCSATRSAVAANSRNGPAKTSDTLCHQLPQQLCPSCSERVELLVALACLTRILVGVRGERIDGEQLERAFTREAALGQQTIEGTRGCHEADLRRLPFVGVSVRSKQSEHLPRQRRRRERRPPRDPILDRHLALSRGRMIAGAPRIAASSFSASGMPACAMCGLPPPFPPATAAISRTSASARTPRSLRSSVTTTNSVVLPSAKVEAMTPTPDFSCSRSASPMA